MTSKRTLRYYNEIIQETPLLNAEEEKHLANVIKRGKNRQAAREKLFNANVRLVIKHAHKVLATSETPLDDLISGGSEGLMYAIDKFNPCKYKTRFSTYACEYIRHYINKVVIDFNSRVHVPQNILVKSKKYQELIEKNPDMGRRELKKRLGITDKGLNKLENYSSRVYSIDAPKCVNGHSDDDLTIGDTLKDVKSEMADDQTMKEEEKAILLTALDILDDSQKDIIKSRYLSNEKATLLVLGKKYGVSRERVRQLEEKALEKMRWHLKRKL